MGGEEEEALSVLQDVLLRHDALSFGMLTTNGHNDCGTVAKMCAAKLKLVENTVQFLFGSVLPPW